MSFVLISKMVLSPHEVWPDLERQRPRLLGIIVFMALPLSLLPPFMLYNAGIHYGDALIAGWSSRPWDGIALIFLAGEFIAFGAMGWLIKNVAGSANARIDYRDAYLVAAIAPVPMWLSALSLLVPNLVFNVFAALSGLGVSCTLMYHGVLALSDMKEEIEAAGATYTVMAAGMIAWALLLVPLLLA